MSSKQIGNQSVTWARKFYESQGYVVSSVELSGRFRKYKDAFSEWFDKELGVDAGFDLLAISESRPAILVQVTTTTAKVHHPFKEFAKRFSDCIKCEQFVRVKGKNNNKIYKYLRDGSYTIWEIDNNGIVSSTKHKRG